MFNHHQPIGIYFFTGIELVEEWFQIRNFIGRIGEHQIERACILPWRAGVQKDLDVLGINATASSELTASNIFTQHLDRGWLVFHKDHFPRSSTHSFKP